MSWKGFGRMRSWLLTRFLLNRMRRSLSRKVEANVVDFKSFLTGSILSYQVGPIRFEVEMIEFGFQFGDGPDYVFSAN